MTLDPKHYALIFMLALPSEIPKELHKVYPNEFDKGAVKPGKNGILTPKSKL